MSERMAHYRVDAMEAPRGEVPDDGWCDLAIHSGNEWDSKDRPAKWFLNEQCLIVHTTGSGLPKKAQENGRYPTVRAENYYGRSHGCHLINGYRGHMGGDLIQMAHDGEQANGVGTVSTKKSRAAGKKSQRDSILGRYGGDWTKDLPASLVKRLKERWPGYPNPLNLLPASPNACGIHMECPPLTKFWLAQGFEPAFPGSYFTQAQYDTIAAVGVDLAARKRWPYEWWRKPNLLGHEDLTPISRHDRRGGWDPGALRSSPRFDWRLVIEEITRLLGWEADDDDYQKLPKVGAGGPYAKY